MPVKPDRAPLADDEANGGVALLVVDMISTWDFPDGAKLGRAALAIAPRIGALKERCARAGVPVIYVNDNRGRWRSEFRELVRVSASASAIGAQIAASLLPGEGDYSVLKPKHSAFYATPLDLLLRHLRVQQLIVTGVASDQCIVMTAAEAKMRDYDVLVAADCVGALTAARTASALRHLEQAHGVATAPSARIRLPGSRGARTGLSRRASRTPTRRTARRPRATGRAGRRGFSPDGRRGRHRR